MDIFMNIMAYNVWDFISKKLLGVINVSIINIIYKVDFLDCNCLILYVKVKYDVKLSML